MKTEVPIPLRKHGKYTIQKWDDYLDRVATRMEQNAPDNRYRNEFISHMRNYEKEHGKELSEAYNCYKNAISCGFIEKWYELIDEKELKCMLTRCKVMVITANPIEKAVLHSCVTSNGQNKKIIRIICGTNAYFIFKWGAYWVAHIHQPQTGSYKDLGMNTTVNEALKHFKPNVILSLGVAFGIDFESQNIGDVIVSKKLFPYSENKRDEEFIKPDRSQDKSIDSWLDVRFVNANGFLDGVTYGGVLSGGSVMSSFDEKDKVCNAYTKNDFVVGGEMEGSALFQVSNNCDIPCAVIKGICDWGIAKNDIFPGDPIREETFKDSLQAFAMINVVEKCFPLLNDKTIFSTSKTKSIDEEKKKNKRLFACNLLTNIIVLFFGLGLFSVHRYSIESVFYVGILLIVISIIGFVSLWLAVVKKETCIFKRKII